MLFFITTIVLVFVVVRWLLRKLTIGGYSGRYVFITGCDTGFGHALAVRLDQLGFHVFAGCLTDSGCQDLNVIGSNRLIPVQIDVTSDTSIDAAVVKVKTSLPHNKGLWAVVNNAGVTGSAGPNEWQTRKDYQACIDVNLLGVVCVTRAFQPLIRKEKGRIVNMSSMMGRFTTTAGPYTVTKYGVEGFSDCLRHQMYQCSVSVHIIEPGFFATDLIDKRKHVRELREKFDQLDTEARQYYGTTFRDTMTDALLAFDKWSYDIDQVVDAYVHSITAKYPKARYVVGKDANITWRLFWNLPEWITTWFIGSKMPVPKGNRN